MPPRHHLGLRRDEVVQLILKHSVPTVIKETRLLRIAQSFPKGIHRLEHHLPGRILEHRDISDNTSTETLIALAKAQLAKADNRLFEAVAAANSHRELTKGNEQRIRTLSTISKSSRIRLSRLQRAITPLSPHSPPVQRRLQSPPAKSKFLAVIDLHTHERESGSSARKKIIPQ